MTAQEIRNIGIEIDYLTAHLYSRLPMTRLSVPHLLFLFCILSLRRFVFELKKNCLEWKVKGKSKRFKLYEWEGNVQGLDCMNNISNIRDIKLLFWITTSFYCRIDFALICILIIDQKKFISKFISYTYIKYTCRIWLKN